MFFDETTQGIILRVRLSPNSSCCQTNGIFKTPDNIEYLKINIISVPEKGKANQELISWLAKQLKIAKSNISIISGELDRYKKILITTNKLNIMPILQAWIEKE